MTTPIDKDLVARAHECLAGKSRSYVQDAQDFAKIVIDFKAALLRARADEVIEASHLVQRLMDAHDAALANLTAAQESGSKAVKERQAWRHVAHLVRTAFLGDAVRDEDLQHWFEAVFAGQPVHIVGPLPGDFTDLFDGKIPDRK